MRVLTNLHPHAGLLMVWALGLLLLLAGRYAYDYLLKLIYGGQVDVERALLLGGCEACSEVVESLRPPRDCASARLIGVVGEETHPREWQDAAGLRSLGSYEDLERIVDTQHVDQLIVADYEIERRHLPALIELCRRRDLDLKLANLEMRFGPGSVCLVPGIEEPIFVVRESFTGALPWFAKRIADRLAAALLLVLLSPVFLVIGVLIKATSPGPVFFVDTRVGLGQKTFRCFKFRTMYENAAELQAELEARNEADGAIFKIRDDPRVTPRRALSARRASTSCRSSSTCCKRRHEPGRAAAAAAARQRAACEAWHKRRHVVLPGITGLWQVSGRSDTSFRRDDRPRLPVHRDRGRSGSTSPSSGKTAGRPSSGRRAPTDDARRRKERP